MTSFTHRRVVTTDDAAHLLRPRADSIVAETEMGSGRFELAEGPFSSYERIVVLSPAPSDTVDGVKGGGAVDNGAGTQVATEEFHYRIAAPAWKVLLAWPVRRVLRNPPDTTPWWAPPDRFDAATATAVSLLCVAAIITGYLGAIIGQVATFATDEFGSTDRQQGILFAAVRIGVVLTVAVTVLADTRGRKRLLIMSLLASCALTIVGAASTGLVTLGISQATARGFSAAVGVLIGIMAAEVSPRSSRAYIISLLALSAGLGAGIPVWFLFVADLHERGWRLLLLLAVPMIPVVLWIGRNLTESERFRSSQNRTADPSPGAPPAMMGSRLAVVAAVGFLLLLFAAPASQFRNEFLRDERAFSAARVSLFVIITNTPIGIGVAIAGKLADRTGRKPVGLIAVTCGVVGTLLTYVFTGASMWVVAVLASVIGAGAAPALGVYQAELFGTGRRGRANAITTVSATLGSVAGLILVGELSDRFGSFAQALLVVSAGPLIVLGLVAFFYPESAHQELEDLNPGDRVGRASASTSASAKSP